MGRFTCIAAFRQMEVYSSYKNGNKFEYKNFGFNLEEEIYPIEYNQDLNKEDETRITLKTYIADNVREGSKLTLESFAEKLSSHCLIFYLENKLPKINIIDDHEEEELLLSDTYSELKRERERTIKINNEEFKAYILLNPKSKNRKNHLLHYCSNSREVGEGKSLALIDSLFEYPILKNGTSHFLDVYVISSYLNKHTNPTRNKISLPTGFFASNEISFGDIESRIVEEIKDQFEDVVLDGIFGLLFSPTLPSFQHPCPTLFWIFGFLHFNILNL